MIRQGKRHFAASQTPRVSQAREVLPLRMADPYLVAEPLAVLMEDAGYRCCATHEEIHKCLSKYDPLSEETVAQVLAMMARTMNNPELQSGQV